MVVKNFAFIDSQNLNLGVKSMGWDLDWRKLRQYLKSKYRVEIAYLFIGHVVGNESLYKFLKESGYFLVFKPTLENKNKGETVIKGNVDAELVLHTMIQYPNYDKAVIISGDGDFHCLVEYLDKQNKLEKILVPTRHYSSLLRKFNQKRYIVRIDLMQKSLAQKKTGIRGRPKPWASPVIVIGKLY